MSKLNLLSSILLLITPVISLATSMIETRDSDGTVSTIYIEDDRARIEMSGQQGFLVMDIKNKSLKIVLHPQQAILDMSDFFMKEQTGSNGQYTDIYTEPKGLGPKIAGYETEEYEIFSNDKYCGSTFVSVRAVQDLGLKKFIKALDSMSEYIEKKMSGMHNTQSMDECEQANHKISEKIQDIGFPLRSTDKYKRLQNEVTRISSNASLPANAFTLPADYKITTPEKLMGNAVKQLKQLQPEMLKMLKNLPPEAREMMMKQLQNIQ